MSDSRLERLHMLIGLLTESNNILSERNTALEAEIARLRAAAPAPTED